MFTTLRVNRDAGLTHKWLLIVRQLAIGLLTAMMLTACAGSPTKESTGQYIDDAAITAKVKGKLLDNKDVSALDIHVETFKGTVQLSGFAKTVEQRQKAEQIAQAVGGVKDVRNDITLK